MSECRKPAQMQDVFNSFYKVAEPLKYLISRPQHLAEVKPSEELTELIKKSVWSDDMLYLASFKTESATGSYEKNAYKQLKQKMK